MDDLGRDSDGNGITMNEAFLGPFAVALTAAMVDDTVARNANMLALVDERIYTTRPSAASAAFVVLDIPFGGRPPAYVHGPDGDAVGVWTKIQVTGWSPVKYTAIQVMDAVIQAIDGRDLVVSDSWNSVRLFQRLAPQSINDDISDQRMYGVFARYEVLFC